MLVPMLTFAIVLGAMALSGWAGMGALWFERGRHRRQLVRWLDTLERNWQQQAGRWLRAERRNAKLLDIVRDIAPGTAMERELEAHQCGVAEERAECERALTLIHDTRPEI